MRTVALEGIAKSPIRALCRWVWRFVDFWRAVYSRPMAFYENPAVVDPVPPKYACQQLRDSWLDACWESRLLGAELMSFLAITGLIGTWLSPRTWKVGVILTMGLFGISFVTSVVENPAYRYRMVLEPAMIVSIITGWSVIVDVIRRGTKSLWNCDTSGNP